MEQATIKQVNYLLALNKDLKKSELKELSKIEASKLIRKLLKIVIMNGKERKKWFLVQTEKWKEKEDVVKWNPQN